MTLDEDDRRYMEAAQQCVAHWKSVDQRLAVPAELGVKFRVCFPLIAHAMNHVTHAIDLAATAPFVMASGARIALEHALTAQWVQLTHDGEITLVNHMTHSWMVRTAEFASAAGEEEELAPILERPPIDGKERSFSMSLVFARFESSGLFYDVYRDLAQAVHPSYGTVTAHLAIRPDEADSDRPTKIDPHGRRNQNSSTALGLGLAAVLACDALERLREGSPDLDLVGRIAADAGLPSDLRLSDQNPDLQHPGPTAD